ncbi:MAG: hypothetical protein DRR08_07820 [Candidatus Parabeggiatoa sp. nov. 2]|nr:MAG: hypothetical protein B6247_02490 [Beggiatoa sp. 4572_84]RKZ61778.1 MAG: hypothetical protein DRR08_07820 [Gammaproteobacteria bacterium]
MLLIKYLIIYASLLTIGIDLNANHIALVETDRFCNLIETQTLPLNTYGKSKGQTEALIGEAVKVIVKRS